MKKTRILLFLLMCFASTAYAQSFDTPPTEEQRSAHAKLSFAYAKVQFNIPEQFHIIGFTDTDNGWCVGVHNELIACFNKLVTNKDTSVVIGVYVSGHYPPEADYMDMKANAKKALYYVDTLAADFVRYNKDRLTAWHSDFGVEYPLKVQLFMKRFTEAKKIQIANYNRELRIVYLFTESQRKNIDGIIKKTQNIVVPIDN
jgi:hypothetical protein